MPFADIIFSAALICVFVSGVLVGRSSRTAPAPAQAFHIVERVRFARGERVLLIADSRLTSLQHVQLSAWLRSEGERVGAEFVLADGAVTTGAGQ